jgi:hypothetical protein
MDVEGTQALPAPVEVLPVAEVDRLVRRALANRSVSEVRQEGGFALRLTTQAGAQQVVWATLGKQDGLLAVFSGEKLLATADKSLAEITKVQPVVLPGLPHFALMVDDRYDEMVGAYLRERRRRIYVWDGRGLREVYKGLLESEQYSHARWENPRGPAAWRLRRVRGDIALRDGVLTERTTTERLEAPGLPTAPIPAASAFRLLGQETAERTLRWNERLRRFDPA